MIPADKFIYTPDTSRFLWDEYKNVLEKAQLAESILSDGEKILLKKAEDFLFETIDQDGFQFPSNSQTVNN